MVFRRGLALLCVAAALALADVGVDAKERQVATALKESKVEYPNGVVLISTADDGKAATKTGAEGKKQHRKSANTKEAESEDESSDDAKHHKKKAARESKMAETTATNGEVTRKYAHGSVRIFKKEVASAPATKGKEAADTHLHKKEVVHEVHASTSAHRHKHSKDASGEVTKDFKLKEGVNQFNIEGVPLKITVDNGHVDVNVNGKHVESGSEITVEAPEPHAEKQIRAKHEKKEHKKEAVKHEKKEAAKHEKKEAAKHEKKEHKKEVAKHKSKKEAAKKEASVSTTADKAKDVDEKAARVTELATKLSKSDHSFFSTETAPVVFICGIIGALATVVGIAAIAASRAHSHTTEDGNLQSVLDNSSEYDMEAAAQDAPADPSDSLEDSESDNDDDSEAGEGTFANNERAGTVSV